ncbi:MAG: phosphoribosylamine--glycine ligase [Bacteroidales bacterium]|nr:phosphoribosylamine--glycine ligase [Bacteroidales bacterium]
MKILLLGSGGREHALAWKMAQSKNLSRLFIAPGNAGTATLGENIPVKVDDFEGIGRVALDKKIDMVVVGPEDPLVKGITDYFSSEPNLKHIPVIGPTAKGALLEGSKEFAKEFMIRHKIPTAKHFSVTDNNLKNGLEYLSCMQPPFVLKADGLAAGKGVLILDSLAKAREELKAMINGKFGQASSKVVIEEFLKGIELSVFIITDGESYLILPEAKDYKRIGEGDTGLNTGGMGCVSPVPFADKDFLKKVEERIIKPTVEGLKKDNIEYKGFIFFGLMNYNGDPFVVEYNVRMGDPEAEVVLPRLKTDLVNIFKAVAEKNLLQIKVDITPQSCATVMLVSGGYPEAYEKNKEITGFENIDDSLLFHAGSAIKDGSVITSGGRVMAISSMGNNFQEALKKSYKNAEFVTFDKKHYRKDIGFDL